MIPLLAKAGATDFEGRIAQLVGGGGFAFLLVLAAGSLAALISTQVSRKGLIWTYALCLMFSGHLIEFLDSGSTMLRWLLIAGLVCSAGKGRDAIGPICAMLGTHWAFSMCSVLWSPTPSFGIQLSLLSFLLTVPAAMALSNELASSRSLDTLPKILNVCALVYIANAIYGFSGLTGARYSGASTSAPLFVITGGVLMPSLLWGYLTTPVQRTRWLCMASLIFIFAICFLSGQRTGLFAGILGCIPLLFARRGMRSNLVFGTVVVGAGILYAGFQIFPEQAEFIHRRYATTSVTGREYAWRWGSQIIFENPILGYGAGSHATRGFGFHNAFLQEWHNGGISGLFLFGGAFVLMLFKSARMAADQKLRLAERELARLLLGWTIVMVSGAFFESKLASPSNVLAFLAMNVGLMIHHLELRVSSVRNASDFRKARLDRDRFSIPPTKNG